MSGNLLAHRKQRTKVYTVNVQVMALKIYRYELSFRYVSSTGCRKNVLSLKLMVFGKILPEDQDRAELLYGYTITRTSKKAGL